MTDGEWTYTWRNGRELASMSKGNITWNYTYDANGMRTSRTNGTKTYNYVYNGSQLTQMTVGSDTLYFTYGAMGPATVTWDGYTYYYVLNGQGDVTAILDEDGIPVVWYNWNTAWGYNPEPEGLFADTLGVLNPLRYRSYVYDTETGYYYLQSRYYDPKIGRFINADTLVSTGQGMLGNNMFAYCRDNPVNGCDPCGTCFHNFSWKNCPKCDAFWKGVEDGWNDFTGALEKGWNAFSQSCSITGEIGYGFGAKGKVGTLSVEGTAIIVGDAWTYNTDGTSESIRKASLSLQAEVIENVNAGLDLTYSVPLPEGKEKGLLGANGGNFDAVIGAYAYDFGLGYNTMPSRDIEFSFGFGAYLVMGGGFEISFNISKFLAILNGG